MFRDDDARATRGPGTARFRAQPVRHRCRRNRCRRLRLPSVESPRSAGLRWDGRRPDHRRRAGLHRAAARPLDRGHEGSGDTRRPQDEGTLRISGMRSSGPATAGTAAGEERPLVLVCPRFEVPVEGVRAAQVPPTSRRASRRVRSGCSGQASGGPSEQEHESEGGTACDVRRQRHVSKGSRFCRG